VCIFFEPQDRNFREPTFLKYEVRLLKNDGTVYKKVGKGRQRLVSVNHHCLLKAIGLQQLETFRGDAGDGYHGLRTRWI
jgi:hypothetical protein